jgi:hypothetical protein
MADKDVDEQFAAIMAHWDEEARGIDPFGDPSAESSGQDRDIDRGTIPGARPDEPSHRAGDGPESGPPAAPAPTDPEPPGAETTADARSAESRPPDVRPPAPQPRPPAPEPDAGGDAALGEEPPSPVPGSAWRRHDAAEVDEHFEPPPPAPLPSSEDKHFWTMLGALVGGPLLFLYLLLFNRDGNGWWMTFALLVSVAGFVLLVLRQPNERDEDDDGVRL